MTSCSCGIFHHLRQNSSLTPRLIFFHFLCHGDSLSCLVQRYPLIGRHINKDLIHAHPNPTEQKTPCWTDLPAQSTLPPLCNNKFRLIRANMFARLQPEGPGCCNMLQNPCMDSYMQRFEGKGCMPRGQHACI